MTKKVLPISVPEENEKLGLDTLIGRKKIENKEIDNVADFGQKQALRRLEDQKNNVTYYLERMCKKLYGEIKEDAFYELRNQMAHYTGCGSFRNRNDFIPKRRSDLLKMGVFLGVSLDDMNKILVKRKKRELNARSLQDLVWMYLILNDKLGSEKRCDKSNISGEKEFKELYDRAYEVYEKRSQEENLTDVKTSEKTIILRDKLIHMKEEPLEDFVYEHYYDLKLFYKKPQAYLKACLNVLLEFDQKYDITTKDSYRKGANGEEVVCQIKATANRYAKEGYINTGIRDYLEVGVFFDAADIRNNIAAPKMRDQYICMGLCLGCSKKELDTVLELAGYAPLSPAEGRDEATLIGVLGDWDDTHKDAVAFRNKYFPKVDEKADYEIEMSSQRERNAIKDLLHLKADVRNAFQMEIDKFHVTLNFEIYEHNTIKAILVEDVIECLLELEKIPYKNIGVGNLKKAFRYHNSSTLYEFEKDHLKIILYTPRIGVSNHVFKMKFTKEKRDALKNADKGFVAFRLENGDCLMVQWERIAHYLQSLEPKGSQAIGEYWAVEIRMTENEEDKIMIKGNESAEVTWVLQSNDNLWT